MKDQLDQASKNMVKKQKNSRVSVISLNVNSLLKRGDRLGCGGGEEGSGELHRRPLCAVCKKFMKLESLYEHIGGKCQGGLRI